MAPKALITGITGQDGSYLAELLLSKGYEVHGIVRRTSTMNRSRIDHIHVDEHDKNAKLFLHYGDMSDSGGLNAILDHVKPDEVYNLAAQSHVKVSFENSEYTVDVTGLGTLRLLESMRRIAPKARFYQASSSEMYGGTRNDAYTEADPFYPRSPYAAAKVYAHYQTINYREAYNLHASNGILFNHESPRRGESFVTRKVTLAAARIKMGLQDRLYMGNIDSYRDWGFAGDYVEAMWLMLQQDQPDDYVVATGETHTVRELLEVAFAHLDMDYKEFFEIDPKYFRPTEVDHLLGNPGKAKKQLNWEPKVAFKELTTMMVDSDLKIAKRELALKNFQD